MTDKTKSHYWAIMDNDKVVMTGTFKECWDNLVTIYGASTLDNLTKRGIKVTRIK